MAWYVFGGYRNYTSLFAASCSRCSCQPSFAPSALDSMYSDVRMRRLIPSIVCDCRSVRGRFHTSSGLGLRSCGMREYTYSVL